jgi:hypothetical protein
LNEGGLNHTTVTLQPGARDLELVKKFLFYAQAARPRKGLLSFSLSQMQNECDASVFEQVMNGVGFNGEHINYCKEGD